jgi:hydroxymethylpyrimidine pyrophosphatase-like HAD family hydrolase
MGNAVPEAKAAADFVTLDNEHSGVAHALHTLGIL